jgi:DNA-binding response OmpR family regulator
MTSRLLVTASLPCAEPGNRQTWDLLLLDLMLPLKDGFEVCRELRRARVRTPIIMLTAKTQEAEKIMGLELGADDYITKPFSPRELRARIKAMLRRFQDGQVSENYRCSDFEIHFDRGELRRGKRSLDATPLELKILAAFIRRRGRVLTRQQSIDEAWGRDTFVTDRVVDAHIVNLRRKIEPKPRAPRYLLSVRGIGYRFDG